MKQNFQFLEKKKSVDGYYDRALETKNEEQLGVKNPEQIHILGSKQDIEGFKEFVSNENNAPREAAFSPDFSTFTELKEDIFENCRF